MQSNYPCYDCGHEFGAHKIKGVWDMGCVRCDSLIRLGMIPQPNYHKFIPDNLAYLEQKFETSIGGCTPSQG